MYDLEFQAKWDVLGVSGGVFILYAFAYPALHALTGHVSPAAPVFGLAPCPSAIFTAGLLLWTRPGMPMYVLVVPFVWLMAQAPADALALSVVADVARVPISVVTSGLLMWREYHAVCARVAGAATVLLAIIATGHDTLLMPLAAIYLLAVLAASYMRRGGRRSMQRGRRAEAPAR